MSTQDSNAHRPEPEAPARCAGWIQALARIEELRYRLQRVRCEAVGDSDSFGHRQSQRQRCGENAPAGQAPWWPTNEPSKRSGTARRGVQELGCESPLALQRSVGSIIEGGG